MRSVCAPGQAACAAAQEIASSQRLEHAIGRNSSFVPERKLGVADASAIELYRLAPVSSTKDTELSASSLRRPGFRLQRRSRRKKSSKDHKVHAKQNALQGCAREAKRRAEAPRRRPDPSLVSVVVGLRDMAPRSGCDSRTFLAQRSAAQGYRTPSLGDRVRCERAAPASAVLSTFGGAHWARWRASRIETALGAEATLRSPFHLAVTAEDRRSGSWSRRAKSEARARSG